LEANMGLHSEFQASLNCIERSSLTKQSKKHHFPFVKKMVIFLMGAYFVIMSISYTLSDNCPSMLECPSQHLSKSNQIVVFHCYLY
jgi:uncharacterized membrane protein